MGGGVTLPLEWFLGVIAGLGGVITLLARTVFKLQEDRRAFDLANQQKTLEVIQASTAAQNDLSESIEALGKVITALADRVKPQER